MDWLQTIIIAIVEGLTEFLPVSSTGHMIITQNLLGLDAASLSESDKAFVHPVWCHSLGGLPLLETFLPLRQLAGT